VKFRLATLVFLVIAFSLALGGCGMSKRLMFWKKEKPAPEVVNELELVNADGTPANFPQYWRRNTLVIDLTGVGGTGNVAARLREEATWPVRVAVRVRPGSVQQLEVRGEERNVLPISADGVKSIDIELASSVYTPTTAAIYLSWGPMPAFAEAAPVADPGFVSPTQLPPTSAPEEKPAAQDIIPPAEAAPVQPSPPPGS